MFSLNQTDEIAFQIQPTNDHDDEEQGAIQQHHRLTILDHQAPTTTNVVTTTKRIRTGHDHTNNTTDESNGSKKIMHREIERLRRQEMGNLYGSLRNLIPLQFIKGKRSISDHMHQAVTYINHLQTNIKELDIKRDTLKKMSDNINNAVTHGMGGSRTSNNVVTSNSNSNNIIVTVNSCWCGVEILITSGLMDKGFHLSRIMEILLEDGFNVISYASTRANDRLLHTIQCEASDATCIDIPSLQQKLNAVNICG